MRNGEMEMPTPCPGCNDVVELNDMRTCDGCSEMFCDDCISRKGSDWYCQPCEAEAQDECEYCGAPMRTFQDNDGEPYTCCADDCQNEDEG